MKPWLFIPPKLAHNLTPVVLHILGKTRGLCTLTWKPLEWRGLRFDNRIGIAGGVDKNATTIAGWWTLGPGFIEIGTVTPRPQKPNPGKIIDRDRANLALWNKMGFPSKGMKTVATNLLRLNRPHHTPVFVNIGKNRDTPNEKAAEDYVACIETLSGHADAFVVNISSPNTKGLRDLQSAANLEALLRPVLRARSRSSYPSTPVLLKLSPDLSDDDLRTALDVSLNLNLDGWILTNTTLSRYPKCRFPAEGGVSGAPLAELSKQMLKKVTTHLGSRKEDRLLISVGGILTPEDVFERLSMGADLVQVYTALIYQGPGFFKKVHQSARKQTSVLAQSVLTS